jgi:hypothetical protein
VLWQRESPLGVRLKASLEVIAQAGERRINPRPVAGVADAGRRHAERTGKDRLPTLPDAFGLPRLGVYISMLTNAAAMRVVRAVLGNVALWSSLPVDLHGSVRLCDKSTAL